MPPPPSLLPPSPQPTPINYLVDMHHQQGQAKTPRILDATMYKSVADAKAQQTALLDTARKGAMLGSPYRTTPRYMPQQQQQQQQMMQQQMMMMQNMGRAGPYGMPPGGGFHIMQDMANGAMGPYAAAAGARAHGAGLRWDGRRRQRGCQEAKASLPSHAEASKRAVRNLGMCACAMH